MIARPKTDIAPPLPRLVPIGYETPSTQRRFTRPLHSRRVAILANAEAVFKIHDEKQRASDDKNNSRLIDTSHDIIRARRK